MKWSRFFCLLIGIFDVFRHVKYLIVGVTARPYIDSSNYAESYARSIKFDQIKASADFIYVIQSYGYDCYLAVLGFMSIFAASLILGVITKRTVFIWPWLFATFHVMGNVGYSVIQLLFNDASKGRMVETSIGNVGYAYVFGIYVALWSTVFFTFKRMYLDNIVGNRKEVNRV